MLARRARQAPHTPWIFYRDGWDWAWRSWARVADQVARGTEALGERWPGDKPSIGFDAGQFPDAVAAGLAIQAAGGLAVPIPGSDASALEGALAAGCAAWATTAEAYLPETPAGLERIDLPAAPSPLDRTELRPLVVAPDSLGAIVLPSGDQLSQADRLSQADLAAAAERLGGPLPSPVGRPIVCVAPGLDPRVSQQIQAWILLAGAAWVLEDEPEAFAPTVLWARPTLVIASSTELAALAPRLAVRKHRRHHRIEAVAVVGEERPETDIWDDLDIPIGPLSIGPLSIVKQR